SSVLYEYLTFFTFCKVLRRHALGDLLTYVVTSAQLAIGHPDPVAGFMGSFVKFLTVFAVTQIPLAISEGLLTLVIYNVISDYQKEGGYKLEEIK
ncbi:energy-coupling factor ABC transporter permease, partial [Filifactor villosus]